MSDLADHMTGPNAQFLRKTTLVKRLFTKMNPTLKFTNMFPAQAVDSRAAVITKEQYSAADDPLKVAPAALTEGADWPTVTVSPMTQESAMLQKYGLELRVGEDVINLSSGYGSIMKGINDVAFWMAQWLNTRFGNTAVNGATALGANFAPAAEWSDKAASDPFTDLTDFKACMRRVDTPYVCTDIYTNTTNYGEFEKYLLEVNADLARRQVVGQTTLGNDTVFVPGLGVTVHRVDDGISEGTLLGLDYNNPCGTYYYFNNPQYSVGKFTYTVRGPDGTPVQKTTNGLGLNTYQYFDDSKMEVVTKFWFDSIFVVEDAYGAITDTGI